MKEIVPTIAVNAAECLVEIQADAQDIVTRSRMLTR